jgi:hypothetical protein
VISACKSSEPSAVPAVLPEATSKTEGVKLARAVIPALRTVAPREHQQASQASGDYNCTARAIEGAKQKGIGLNNLPGGFACSFDHPSQFDSNSSPHCFLLTDLAAAQRCSLLAKGGVDKLSLVSTTSAIHERIQAIKTFEKRR